MKKYFAIFSFLILSSTVFANPVGGSIGGWQVVSNVANGIGAKITATKEVMINGASKVATGTANITPKISDFGRFMGKVGAAAVVTEAMNQLLDGVDYVMDPANNRVQYKIITDPTLADGTLSNDIQYNCNTGQSFNTVTQCANEYVNMNKPADIRYKNCNKSGNLSCYFYEIYEGKEQPGSVWSIGRSAPRVISYPTNVVEEKSVPLVDVGAQIIDQAEQDIKAGNVASPAVALSRAVAQDMVQEAETDDTKARPIANQFEQAPVIPTNEDATGTIDTPEVVDPITGEVVKPAETSSIAMQFPKACEWFPQLCLFIDWMQKPQELDEPDLPTKEIEKKEIDEELIKISSSSCPAPIDVNIPLPVFNTTYTDSISVSDYCPEIEKLAPVLQLLAFVLAIMIIKDI